MHEQSYFRTLSLKKKKNKTIQGDNLIFQGPAKDREESQFHIHSTHTKIGHGATCVIPVVGQEWKPKDHWGILQTGASQNLYLVQPT